MSAENWKPWWEKVAEIDNPAERREFMRGVGGARKITPGEQILFAIIAGYVGGKVAQRIGNKK